MVSVPLDARQVGRDEGPAEVSERMNVLSPLSVRVGSNFLSQLIQKVLESLVWYVRHLKISQKCNFEMNSCNERCMHFYFCHIFNCNYLNLYLHSMFFQIFNPVTYYSMYCNFQSIYSIYTANSFGLYVITLQLQCTCTLFPCAISVNYICNYRVYYFIFVYVLLCIYTVLSVHLHC